MNIQSGFQIDTPNIFVPWNINAGQLETLFKDHKLNHVTTGYFTISCESLNGLQCNIGFHLTPANEGLLKEFEFYFETGEKPEETFKQFQFHFEREFGKPVKEINRYQGYPDFEWILGDVQIIHKVIDRFGPEEHMRIRKLS